MATGTGPAGSAAGRGTWAPRAVALVLALVVGGVGVGVFAPGTSLGAEPAAMAARAQDGATPAAATPVGGDACPDELYGAGAEPWIRSELYFGAPAADGAATSDELWLAFLADEVTPRFPAGLTVLTGLGQWQGSDGQVSQQVSQVLIILRPMETAAEDSAKLEEIRDAYEVQFDQESVLRSDGSPFCTSF